jgi:hypothetical protein
MLAEDSPLVNSIVVSSTNKKLIKIIFKSNLERN